MTSIFAVLAAGLLQGLLEWLPVSSSGQVFVYLTEALGLNPMLAYSYSLALHLATALSAATYYYRFVVKALVKLRGVEARILFIPLITGLPLGLVVHNYYQYFLGKATLDEVNLIVGALLIVTGLIIIPRPTRLRIRQITGISLVDLLAIGVLEALALLPGLSRSGVVTSYLLARGYNSSSAVKIAFVTAIPSTLAAGLYELVIAGSRIVSKTSSVLILSALLVAYLSGLLAILVLDKVAEKLVSRIGVFMVIYGFIIVALHVPLLLALT
ncbi:MAG: undecaprenyl-diphosphate phosphatase [Pyrodictiaceae archaeon]